MSRKINRADGYPDQLVADWEGQSQSMTLFDSGLSIAFNHEKPEPMAIVEGVTGISFCKSKRDDRND